jgi:hypothetical protein
MNCQIEIGSIGGFYSHSGSPRTDAMIAATVQWAERIMRKIDGVYSPQGDTPTTARIHGIGRRWRNSRAFSEECRSTDSGD